MRLPEEHPQFFLYSVRHQFGGFEVEWRVQINQVDGLGIHASHDVEAIASPDCLIFPVRVGQLAIPLFSAWLRSLFFNHKCKFAALVPYLFATNVLVAPIFQQGFYFQPE